MAAPNKKSFEFRMSKKVAELTQVVHMLFTRNHEKEVELEAVKDAYEWEIDHVIEDAQSRTERLELQIRELERKHQGDSMRFQSLLDQEVARREEEWKKRYAELDRQLHGEKKECQNARDLLINAQRDIERLKRGRSEESDRKDQELDARCKELEQMKAFAGKLQKEIKELGDALRYKEETKRTNDKLKREVDKLREEVEAGENVKEELTRKNKELENEIRRLRRELSKSATPSSAKSRQQYEMPSASILDYDEEMVKLKKEVEKYRLELRNREGNFNRMFTEKQPIFVDRRAGKFASFNGFQNGSSGGGDIGHLRYTRERTYHPGMVMVRSNNAFEEELRDLAVTPQSAASSATSTASGGLPHLQGGGGREHRQRTQLALTKPKPLPRQLLSTKTTASH